MHTAGEIWTVSVSADVRHDGQWRPRPSHDRVKLRGRHVAGQVCGQHNRLSAPDSGPNAAGDVIRRGHNGVQAGEAKTCRRQAVADQDGLSCLRMRHGARSDSE